ncbi:DUF4192 domain-containing protein [Streptomyces sp. NPDC059679]|uniref:DUF4192 domain-containing protein n=1 Tax=Streptomyces sp. NPDC059679 TaxID=3346903 RepID=UPI003691E335
MIPPQRKLTIRSMANLAEVLPFILGHYPDDSIVFHCPGPRFIDGPSMTCPLPEDPTHWLEVAHLAARKFMRYALAKGKDLYCDVIIYLCRDPRPGQNAEETAELLRSMANWLVDAIADHRGAPQLTLGLVAGRWWAYTCYQPGCCEGEPLPALDDPNSAAAQLIRLGFSPGRRTSEIAKEFQPGDADRTEQQRRALDNEAAAWSSQCVTDEGQDAVLRATNALLESAMSAFRDGATELADDIAARLIHGLHDELAHDRGMEYAEDDDLPHARRLWAFLARRCIPPYTEAAVPVLTLFAWIAWRQEDILAARLALTQALTADPDYELADVLNYAINSEVDPQGLLETARENRARRLKDT